MSLRIDGGDTFIPQNGNGNGNGAKVNKGTDFSLSNALKGSGITNDTEKGLKVEYKFDAKGDTPHSHEYDDLKAELATLYMNSKGTLTAEDFVKMGLHEKEAKKLLKDLIKAAGAKVEKSDKALKLIEAATVGDAFTLTRLVDDDGNLTGEIVKFKDTFYDNDGNVKFESEYYNVFKNTQTK